MFTHKGVNLLNTEQARKVKTYKVYVKKHRQATLFSLLATILTVVFFYWFVVTVTIPLWGNTVVIATIGLFALFWWASLNAHHVLDTKQYRAVNPFKNKELALAKIVEAEPETRLGFDTNGKPNAFTTGITYKIVVFAEVLLQKLSGSQLTAIAYHEIAHQKNNDVAWSVLRSTLLSAIRAVSLVTFCIMLWYFGVGVFTNIAIPYITFMGSSMSKMWAFALVWFITRLSSLLISLLVNYAARQVEYMADAYTVVMGYGKELKEALVALELLVHPEMKTLRRSWRARIKNLFQNHPLTISRLRNIDVLLNGDEGFVKDSFEMWASVVTLIALWIIGLQHLPSIALWSIFGVPGLYIAGPLFILLVYLFITTPYSVKNPEIEAMDAETKSATTTLMLLLGFVFLIVAVLSGFSSIIWSAKLLEMGWASTTLLIGSLLALSASKKTALNKLLLTGVAVVAIAVVTGGIVALFIV